MIVNPPLGIIKLNMSCTATGSYLTLLLSVRVNQTFKISSLIILNLVMGLTSKFGNHSSQPYLILPKKKKNQISMQY